MPTSWRAARGPAGAPSRRPRRRGPGADQLVEVFAIEQARAWRIGPRPCPAGGRLHRRAPGFEAPLPGPLGHDGHLGRVDPFEVMEGWRRPAGERPEVLPVARCCGRRTVRPGGQPKNRYPARPIGMRINQSTDRWSGEKT